MNENHDWYAKQYKHYQVEDQKGIDDWLKEFVLFSTPIVTGKQIGRAHV